MDAETGTDTEVSFQELVRRSGIVFTTNLGQGPEEWVLALATPTLSKTQVATQADLVAAGYIRQEAVQRVEAERDRLMAALESAEQMRQTLITEKQAQEGQIIELTERAEKAEQWKRGELEGITARNKTFVEADNPHDGTGPIAEEAHQAWRHGWRMRDMLLGLNDRLKETRGAYQALEDAHGALSVAHAELAEAAPRWQAAYEAEALARATIHERHETLTKRAEQMAFALQTVFTEAPHSPACALWVAAAVHGKASVVACDCWRSRFSPTGAPLPPPAPPEPEPMPEPLEAPVGEAFPDLPEFDEVEEAPPGDESLVEAE